ncbi:MAG: hypothetical protein EA387_00895 [Nitriliruptor sp.]|nr:MAG: hypothetical protein EA387_00895 [Nitriliruptor sp.]
MTTKRARHRPVRVAPSGTVGGVDDDRTPADELEFGPSGYLPERASKRARKIVLRAPLGAQWIVASLVAGVAVVIAGLLFLQQSSGAPSEPWIPAAEVAELDRATPGADGTVLLVVGASRVRAFVDAASLAYCEPTNRLESEGGGVWTLTGRGLGGADSLDEHPTTIHDDTVYVDPSRVLPGPPASEEPAEPGCS